jgi:hypothetical protein
MGRGPYYTISQAAHYCGYRSAKHFRRLAEEYDIPAKGPHNNRYAEADLDLWMDQPRALGAGGPQFKSELPDLLNGGASRIARKAPFSFVGYTADYTKPH